MLRVEDLHVHFGKVHAVRGISLEVGEGEVVGMVGPNGAGKTTTLSTIVGLERAMSGEIKLDGQSLLGRSPERVVTEGLSLVPEGRQIFSTLTVEENLRLGATVRRDAGVRADIALVLARFPALGRYLGSPAGELSGGEQQQLAIARALLARPRLLLLDEPSLGLAPRMVDLVFESLDELRRQGVSMLLVEQNARRTIEFADRTYVIQGGVIRMQGAREELLATGDVEGAYLGRVTSEAG